MSRAIRLNRFADSFRAATDIESLPLRAPGPGDRGAQPLVRGQQA